MASSAIVVALLSGAPYQCGRAHDDAREETPPEALYGAAQHLRAEGDERAARSTLTYLAERYPTSRFAVAARLDLAGRPQGTADASVNLVALPAGNADASAARSSEAASAGKGPTGAAR